jgi:DNA-binding CsgD family transcriptional regulator
MDPMEARTFVPAMTGMQALAMDEHLWRQVLHELDYGLILVTLDGAVVFANNAAHRQCRDARTIWIDGPRLEGVGSHNARALRRCLDAAARNQRSLLPLDGDSAIRSVAFVPLQATSGRRVEHAMLVLGRQRSCEPISLALYARRHHITQAEEAVLKDLCDGLRPQQIAERCRVGLSTVRTHISSLRGKTGAATIGELVRTTAMLPPIVAALN